MIAKFKVIVFDDITRNEDGSYWVEICDCCYQKYKSMIDRSRVDMNASIGTCSVQGCWNEADHYIDFEECEILTY